jgi:hypothetical protein
MSNFSLVLHASLNSTLRVAMVRFELPGIVVSPFPHQQDRLTCCGHLTVTAGHIILRNSLELEAKERRPSISSQRRGHPNTTTVQGQERAGPKHSFTLVA